LKDIIISYFITITLGYLHPLIIGMDSIIGASVKERKEVNPNPRCLNFNKILKK
jgi:hypothetical protein